MWSRDSLIRRGDEDIDSHMDNHLRTQSRRPSTHQGERPLKVLACPQLGLSAEINVLFKPHCVWSFMAILKNKYNSRFLNRICQSNQNNDMSCMTVFSMPVGLRCPGNSVTTSAPKGVPATRALARYGPGEPWMHRWAWQVVSPGPLCSWAVHPLSPWLQCTCGWLYSVREPKRDARFSTKIGEGSKQY